MLTYPEIDPVIFEIGFLKIRWYGLMYVIGFVLAWWLARLRCKRPDSPISPHQVDDLIFYAMLGVIIGGRLGYVFFYGFNEFLADPLYPVKIWEGGMSFHGGLLGVIIAMWWFARQVGHDIWTMTDFVAPLVPLGLGFGRIGNFINGELWGAPADGVPWAMRVACDGTPARRALCETQLGLDPRTEWTPPLHPSMLYEALLEGFVLFAILWWFSSKPRPRMAVSGMFLLFYGLFRFAIEFVRVPDADKGYILFGWVTMGQILSAPMIFFGILMLVLAYRAAPSSASSKETQTHA
jgi:phosphatidylglycerol:prolipoprotein diacylglycerol transferase